MSTAPLAAAAEERAIVTAPAVHIFFSVRLANFILEKLEELAAAVAATTAEETVLASPLLLCLGTGRGLGSSSAASTSRTSSRGRGVEMRTAEIWWPGCVEGNGSRVGSRVNRVT